MTQRILLVLALVAIPSMAWAQVQPANKEAVLLQLIEDMRQGRAVVHPSEVEAAGCKVQLKQVQDQLKQAQDEITTIKKTSSPAEHSTK